MADDTKENLVADRAVSLDVFSIHKAQRLEVVHRMERTHCFKFWRQ
jgi:hypothetical protein